MSETPGNTLPADPAPLMNCAWHLRQAQRLLAFASGPVGEDELRTLIMRADAHGKLAKRIAETSLMLNPPWEPPARNLGGQGGSSAGAGGGGGGGYGGGVGGSGGSGGTWRPA